MPVTPSYLEPCSCIKRLPVSVTVLPVKSLSRKQNHADILYRKLSHTADSAEKQERAGKVWAEAKYGLNRKQKLANKFIPWDHAGDSLRKGDRY